MFLITLKQVLILFFYISIGFLLCKGKIVDKTTSKILSKLLIYCFLPAYYVYNLSKDVSIERIKEYFILIFAGIIMLFLAIIIAKLLSKLFVKTSFERGIYLYLFIFSNFGYFGYPLVEMVFGGQMLIEYMMFCLPISLGCNSYGYFILTKFEGGNKTPELTPKQNTLLILKKVFSIPTLSTLAGICLGLLPITIPNVVYEFLEPAKNCYSVSAMLLAGVVLSQCNFKDLFGSAKIYILSVLRLLVIPMIFGGIALLLYKFFSLDKVILTCVVAFTCLPAGMNVIVFPESVGLVAKEGAKACFLSYVLALATVPLWFYLVSTI